MKPSLGCGDDEKMNAYIKSAPRFEGGVKWGGMFFEIVWETLHTSFQCIGSLGGMWRVKVSAWMLEVGGMRSKMRKVYHKIVNISQVSRRCEVVVD